jgi:hypothetical protein
MGMNKVPHATFAKLGRAAVPRTEPAAIASSLKIPPDSVFVSTRR